MVCKGRSSPEIRHNDISRLLGLVETLRSRYVNTWTVGDTYNNDRWTTVGSANLPNIYSQDAADTSRGSLWRRTIWRGAAPLINVTY